MENELPIESKPAVCFLTTFANQVQENVKSVSKIVINTLFCTKNKEETEEKAEQKKWCQSIKKITIALYEATQLNKIDPLMRNLFLIAVVASTILLGPLPTLVAVSGLVLARILARSEKINTFIENNKPALFVIFAISCYAFSAGLLPVAFAVGYITNGILIRDTFEMNLLSPIKKTKEETNDDLF